MTRTPNHDYNIPEKGSLNWHLDLNENFDAIDRDIEIRDEEANKGQYDPKVGAKYEATDSGAVYHGDGENWILSDRQLRSITAENIGSKPVHVVDVRNDRFEAKGYEDLSEAVTDAPKQTVIYVRGNLTVDKPIAPTGTYFGLMGLGGGNRADPDGMPSVTASSNFSGDCLIDLSDVGSKWGFIKDINLFCFGRAKVGIRTGNSDNGLIQGMSLYEPTEIGVKIEGGAFDNVIDRSIIDGKATTRTGVHLTTGNEPKIYRCLIRRYTERGIFIDSVGRVGPRIQDTSLRSGIGGKYGIQINNSGQTGNINILGCQFEDNELAGLAYAPDGNEGSIARFWVAGCHFNQNNGKAIEINQKAGKYIIGPGNQIMAPIELNESAWSQDGSTIMFNTYNSNIINNSRKDLTIIEPMTGEFKFRGKNVVLE